MTMKTELGAIALVDEPDEDQKHQDDFLGSQARCLAAWPHLSYDGQDHRHVMTSIGLATDAEKCPLVEEISASGSPLNHRYFLAVENIELWVNNQLAGLCRYRNVKREPSDELDDETLSFFVTLDAVFVRPRYHSLGFGEVLSEALAEQIVAGIFTHLHKHRPFKGRADLTLFADFNSEQGERFFDNLSDLVAKRMEGISESIGISIEIEVDAGY